MSMQTLTPARSDFRDSFEAPVARLARSMALGTAVVVSLAALAILTGIPGASQAPLFWVGWIGLTVMCVGVYAVGSIVFRHASGQSRRTERWLKRG